MHYIWLIEKQTLEGTCSIIKEESYITKFNKRYKGIGELNGSLKVADQMHR
jgi:hypothetical protein